MLIVFIRHFKSSCLICCSAHNNQSATCFSFTMKKSTKRNVQQGVCNFFTPKKGQKGFVKDFNLKQIKGPEFLRLKDKSKENRFQKTTPPHLSLSAISSCLRKPSEIWMPKEICHTLASRSNRFSESTCVCLAPGTEEVVQVSLAGRKIFTCFPSGSCRATENESYFFRDG